MTTTSDISQALQVMYRITSGPSLAQLLVSLGRRESKRPINIEYATAVPFSGTIEGVDRVPFLECIIEGMERVDKDGNGWSLKGRLWKSSRFTVVAAPRTAEMTNRHHDFVHQHDKAGFQSFTGFYDITTKKGYLDLMKRDL